MKWPPVVFSGEWRWYTFYVLLRIGILAGSFDHSELKGEDGNIWNPAGDATERVIVRWRLTNVAVTDLSGGRSRPKTTVSADLCDRRRALL